MKPYLLIYSLSKEVMPSCSQGFQSSELKRLMVTTMHMPLSCMNLKKRVQSPFSFFRQA